MKNKCLSYKNITKMERKTVFFTLNCIGVIMKGYNVYDEYTGDGNGLRLDVNKILHMDSRHVEYGSKHILEILYDSHKMSVYYENSITMRNDIQKIRELQKILDDVDLEQIKNYKENHNQMKR